jgi:hypothetical protein
MLLIQGILVVLSRATCQIFLATRALISLLLDYLLFSNHLHPQCELPPCCPRTLILSTVARCGLVPLICSDELNDIFLLQMRRYSREREMHSDATRNRQHPIGFALPPFPELPPDFRNQGIYRPAEPMAGVTTIHIF